MLTDFQTAHHVQCAHHLQSARIGQTAHNEQSAHNVQSAHHVHTFEQGCFELRRYAGSLVFNDRQVHFEKGCLQIFRLHIMCSVHTMYSLHVLGRWSYSWSPGDRVMPAHHVHTQLEGQM